MAEHNTLTGSSLHECKQVSTASTSDAGKVITPSSVSAGEGVLRLLTEAEISEKREYVTVAFNSIDTVEHIYFPVSFAGVITSIRAVIDAAFTGIDTILTCRINSTNITNGTLTFTQSGSAAGDIELASPTANRTTAAGDVIRVTSDNGATSALNAVLVFEFTRS
jgi:hypothetical protein